MNNSTSQSAGNVTIYLPPGVELPEGIPIAAIAYLQAHFIDFYGPMIFGGMFDGLLIGLLLHQFACWIGNSRKQEQLWVKVLVYYLVLVSCGHSCYSLAFMMRTFAIGFGDFTHYFNYHWASVFYLFEALTMPPVEAFFAYRAWKLWGSPRSLGILMPAMCLALLLLCILLQVFALDGYGTRKFSIVLYAWVVTLLGLETLVSSLIVTAILKGSNTGFKKTDKLMKRIAVVAIQAQVFPLIGALAFAIRKLALPRNPSGWAFIGMPKFWPIALLSVLNSKYKIRVQIEEERDRRQNTFDLGFTPKPDDCPAMMDVSNFIKNERPEPTITYPQPHVTPVLYFAPDESPSSSQGSSSDPENGRGMPGVVHDLQYIEEEIGEKRRRSIAVKMGQRGSVLGRRRRSSAPQV